MRSNDATECVFGDWGLALKNLVFPIFCKQCGVRLLTDENGFFCPTCWEMSPRVQRPFCSICGKPHKDAVGFGTRSNFPCADCRAAKAPPYYRVCGAALYDGAVKEAVKMLKFYDKRRLAAPLGELMADFARREMDCDIYDYVVPVPLHRVRQRARGFNQSRLLAGELLAVFPKAELDESLRRIRPTRIQSLMKSPEERRANIRGAFAVEGDRLKGKTVLLIDDVVTSGGTISECARALRRAGVERVDVLAAALAASGSW